MLSALRALLVVAGDLPLPPDAAPEALVAQLSAQFRRRLFDVTPRFREPGLRVTQAFHRRRPPSGFRDPWASVDEGELWIPTLSAAGPARLHYQFTYWRVGLAAAASLSLFGAVFARWPYGLSPSPLLGTGPGAKVGSLVLGALVGAGLWRAIIGVAVRQAGRHLHRALTREAEAAAAEARGRLAAI